MQNYAGESAYKWHATINVASHYVLNSPLIYAHKKTTHYAMSVHMSAHEQYLFARSSNSSIRIPNLMALVQYNVVPVVAL